MRRRLIKARGKLDFEKRNNNLFNKYDDCQQLTCILVS